MNQKARILVFPEKRKEERKPIIEIIGDDLEKILRKTTPYWRNKIFGREKMAREFLERVLRNSYTIEDVYNYYNTSRLYKGTDKYKARPRLRKKLHPLLLKYGAPEK